MPDQFTVSAEVLDSNDRVTIRLEGDGASIVLGGHGRPGTVVVRNAGGEETIQLDGGQATIELGGHGEEGTLHLRAPGGRRVIRLASGKAFYGGNGFDGEIGLKSSGGAEPVTLRAKEASISLGAQGQEGDLFVRDAQGEVTVHVDGKGAVHVGAGRADGVVSVGKATGENTVGLDGGTGRLSAGGAGTTGELSLLNRSGDRTVVLSATGQLTVDRCQTRVIDVTLPSGQPTVELDGDNARVEVGGGGQPGTLALSDSGGNATVSLSGDAGGITLGGDQIPGDLTVRDGGGNRTIQLDGANGDIRLAGADCAELFETGEAPVDPGTVLVLEAEGKVAVSCREYDTRVAGVVSGAGGLRPGILLGVEEQVTDHSPIALSGRVYCKVDAAYGAIGPGDLLTTSQTPGHAMKARDPLRSFGAVVGKAMEGHARGRGLIPILVALH